MSELAFELRFVIYIAELSIYLCLVLGSQNHREIRQETRFWRGNSSRERVRFLTGISYRNGRLLDVRCHFKVAFGRDEAGQKRGVLNGFWTPAVILMILVFVPPGVLTHSPIMFISTSEDTKTKMEMLIDAIQVQLMLRPLRRWGGHDPVHDPILIDSWGRLEYCHLTRHPQIYHL